ncbi:hypothetical protein B0H14DRAFT_2624312 [Mycena olivaceomarginata]|nr:hypothetical protein B0H14DRAFT_2624312 [Mycena olivaceomarginata]
MCDAIFTSMIFGTLSATRQPLYSLGCAETLKHPKSNCARKRGTSIAQIQSRLLETHSVATWEELMEYLQSLRDIVQVRKGCEGNTNLNLGGHCLSIETERQREFFEGIKELREIHDSVISASARHTQTVTRRFESIATSM